MLIISACSFAAVKPVSAPSQLEDWNSKTDTWYSIEQDKPDVDAYARNAPPDFSVIGGEYYQNDQTFGDLYFQKINGSNLANFDGSYLFDSGLFVGLDYIKVNQLSETTTFSPGYRFKIGDQGYAAISFDYVSDNFLNTHNIVNYDLDFKLFPKKMMIYGGISLPTAGNVTVINLNANYKVNKTLVVGAGYLSQGSDNAYSAGFTYAIKSWIIDAQLGNYYQDPYYQLAGMANWRKFSLGALYQKYQSYSDPGITIQGKYHLANADLILKYTFQNDSNPQETVLDYQRML